MWCIPIIWIGIVSLAKNTVSESNVTLAPREFPTDDQTLIFNTNATIRDNLANKTTTNDTEVDDLLENNTETILTPLIIADPSFDQTEGIDKNVTEWIEDQPFEAEDAKLFRNYDNNSNNNNNNNMGVIDGQLAAVLAGTFVCFAIFGYVALLSWRRYLEARYGSREMLVDEDFYCNEDVKHFSI